MELPQATPAPINLLSVTNSDGLAFNTRSQTCQQLSTDTSTIQPDVMPEISKTPGSYTKIPDNRWIRSSPTDAEDGFFLQKNI